MPTRSSAASTRMKTARSLLSRSCLSSAPGLASKPPSVIFHPTLGTIASPKPQPYRLAPQAGLSLDCTVVQPGNLPGTSPPPQALPFPSKAVFQIISAVARLSLADAVSRPSIPGKSLPCFPAYTYPKPPHCGHSPHSS